QKTNSKSSEKAWYQYAGGERIRKYVDKGNIKEERIYLGGFEIYRKFEGSSLTIERTTVHVSDDAGRIAMLEKRTVGTDDAAETLTRYVYSNHLQSASLELDGIGDIISYEEYHPYGTTAFQAKNASINAVAKRYRYTGKERDEESGLYYHGARYYIPWLCRWTAIDPMESKYAGMSPYNYSFNNPIMWNDPSGAEPDGVAMASVVEQPDGTITATANKMKEGQKEETISTYSYSGSADIPPSDIQTVTSTSYFHLGSDKFARGWYKESEYVKMMGDVMLGAIHSVTGDTPFGLATSSRYGGDVAMDKADKAFENFKQSGSPSNDFISLIDKYSSKLIHDFKNDYDFRQRGVAYLSDSPIDFIGPGALKLAFSGAKASVNFMRSSITTFNTTSKNLMMRTTANLADDLATKGTGGKLIGFGSDAAITENTNNLIPKKGWYDVVIHGTEDGLAFTMNGKKITPEQLYKNMIDNGYVQGTNIRLMSCFSGSLDKGAAYQLSKLAKANVVAPTNSMWIANGQGFLPAGRLMVDFGGWFKFFKH
ncbi:MAG: RHS repeat-associated core domain-containing protein, partial [Taibaiella sp.]|nr:RHS repeat-associated core domain-containing protein [Taibaiella sp.]